MRTIRKKLSKDQIEEGIIYTSALSTERYELSTCTVHKVYDTNEDKYEKIERLENSKFFKNSHYRFNIIRTK